MKNPSLARTGLFGGNGLASGLLRRLVTSRLAQLRHGQLTVLEDGEEHVYGDPRATLRARIEILDPAAWALVASNGSIGSGEAYVHGYWTTPDLTAVIRVFVANLDVLDDMEGGLALLGRPLLHGLHWLNRNTRAGSQRNISAHYDLGNDLFERMLDPTMMYSAAQYEHPEQSLEAAQLNKLERICQKLRLTPDDHLLEIGSGWGGMAIHAATRFGCKVTSVTLSHEQHAHCQKRIAELGLQDRVEVLLKDYRDLEGRFDKLVSIEMIEAVGHRFLPTYFAQCARLLKDDGLMLLQAITIRDQRYEQARRSVDFIQRYIFPGGALPSVTRMLQVATEASDLNLVHMEDFGTDYARTLRAWHENLARARSELEGLGYDAYFYRLWEFYLCYCEGGFLERAIGTAQLLLAKPGARHAPLLGQLDA
ncbi:MULTISPECIES: SAM-dependent methyltransferase [Pseudomonadaceae]|uniref:Cyclopropane-fatty-acyl-phospholipid synthase family protein n=2 Tax=Gammaproteobacteria TaxID=1236 RepID=A0A7X3KWD4_9GAMM|nr:MULTISPECIES: cyclopropane-fatty-acyl-phospholipid synthase family protein [Pseudomonas]KIV72466.1 Cyclopropane-fatty-acyl-phospholipid synthase, plant type [Pseudomonas sp. FeS53a]MCO7556486.1 cyclopropane-fatty-acyl-phospholipid synthase family protein [Pseudomonas otitidis]MDV3440916.1 cyclopropane-fatty-acyl-phospholipid synthase family protein [Pseudomonas otitidis]MWK58669.1 methyltransferase domain-containing protein [Pseudomonas otitidis]WAF85027.1 cyclopropane-fatty-acyl-phospholip